MPIVVPPEPVSSQIELSVTRDQWEEIVQSLEKAGCIETLAYVLSQGYFKPEGEPPAAGAAYGCGPTSSYPFPPTGTGSDPEDWVVVLTKINNRLPTIALLRRWDPTLSLGELAQALKNLPYIFRHQMWIADANDLMRELREIGTEAERKDAGVVSQLINYTFPRLRR
jgi:hypothetical protein